jgi:hypothetical protein
VDLAAAVVSDEQSFELVQPGEGALDDPAVAAESGTMLGLASGDLRCDPALAQFAASTVVVVTAVGGHTIGPPPGPADLATHRRYPIDERDQLGAVVAIAARERPGERDPGRVDQEVVLGTISGSINRARARLGAPLAECGERRQAGGARLGGLSAVAAARGSSLSLGARPWGRRHDGRWGQPRQGCLRPPSLLRPTTHERASAAWGVREQAGSLTVTHR